MAVRGFRGLCIAAALSAVLATGLVTGLGGCSPIETYRSVRGFTKYDPDPATAPFSGNMAAGEAEDYPNLSTVPPPPTRASTVAERTELTKKLIAERTSTETEAAPLQTAAAGQPGAAAGQPGTTVAGPPGGSATPGAAQRSTLTVAAATPAEAPVAVPAPAPAAASPMAAPEASSAAPAEKAASATGSASTTRRRGHPPAEQPPQNSSLQMPVIPAVPAPEAARPAPPPPHLAAPPAVAAVDLPKTAAAVEMPAPAPAAPALAPPPPTIAALPGPKQSTAAAPQAATLGAFDLSDPPRLDVAQRATLDKIAVAYRNKPGTVKILAYAGTAADSADQLGSFRAALDRAQFVATALAQAGVPSNKIQTEASPAAAGTPPGRVEVRLAP